MTWVKLDDEFAENKKVTGLSDRAFRVHVSGLCHCARLLTDGLLDQRAQRVVLAGTGGSRRHVAELEDAGLWLQRDEGVIEIKDFLEYNLPREKVLAERARNAERQARLRASRNGVTNGVSRSGPVPLPRPEEERFKRE